MTGIFHDVLHDCLEDDVDDIVVKSKKVYNMKKSLWKMQTIQTHNE